MTFETPTLEEAVERQRRAFRTHAPGLDAWLWSNNVGPTAKVVGGATWQLHLRLDHIARQSRFTTADREGLIAKAEDLDMAPLPAGPADGDITVSNGGAAAATVIAGALFRRADGIEYRATEAASIAPAGSADIAAIATSDGETTSALAATPLDIVSGVTGDSVTAEVAADGIVGGVDIEATEAFRERVLFRLRYPPQAGAPADYWRWAREVSGVTAVFVEPRYDGRGSVRVFPLMHDRYTDGVPNAADIARVQDHIDLLAPAGPVVLVQAPTPLVVDITVTDLDPATTEAEEAVLAELRDGFRELARVAGTASQHGSMPFLAEATSFSLSWIWQAVANATGERRHSITSPVADIAQTTAEYPVLGDVTFA